MDRGQASGAINSSYGCSRFKMNSRPLVVMDKLSINQLSPPVQSVVIRQLRNLDNLKDCVFRRSTGSVRNTDVMRELLRSSHAVAPTRSSRCQLTATTTTKIAKNLSSFRASPGCSINRDNKTISDMPILRSPSPYRPARRPNSSQFVSSQFFSPPDLVPQLSPDIPSPASAALPSVETQPIRGDVLDEAMKALDSCDAFLHEVRLRLQRTKNSEEELRSSHLVYKVCERLKSAERMMQSTISNARDNIKRLEPRVGNGSAQDMTDKTSNLSRKRKLSDVLDEQPITSISESPISDNTNIKRPRIDAEHERRRSISNSSTTSSSATVQGRDQHSISFSSHTSKSGNAKIIDTQIRGDHSEHTMFNPISSSASVEEHTKRLNVSTSESAAADVVNTNRTKKVVEHNAGAVTSKTASLSTPGSTFMSSSSFPVIAEEGAAKCMFPIPCRTSTDNVSTTKTTSSSTCNASTTAASCPVNEKFALLSNNFSTSAANCSMTGNVPTIAASRRVAVKVCSAKSTFSVPRKASEDIVSTSHTTSLFGAALTAGDVQRVTVKASPTAKVPASRGASTISATRDVNIKPCPAKIWTFDKAFVSNQVTPVAPSVSRAEQIVVPPMERRRRCTPSALSILRQADLLNEELCGVLSVPSISNKGGTAAKLQDNDEKVESVSINNDETFDLLWSHSRSDIYKIDEEDDELPDIDVADENKNDVKKIFHRKRSIDPTAQQSAAIKSETVVRCHVSTDSNRRISLDNAKSRSSSVCDDMLSPSTTDFVQPGVAPAAVKHELVSADQVSCLNEVKTLSASTTHIAQPAALVGPTIPEMKRAHPTVSEMSSYTQSLTETWLEAETPCNIEHLLATFIQPHVYPSPHLLRSFVRLLYRDAPEQTIWNDMIGAVLLQLVQQHPPKSKRLQAMYLGSIGPRLAKDDMSRERQIDNNQAVYWQTLVELFKKLIKCRDKMGVKSNSYLIELRYILAVVESEFNLYQSSRVSGGAVQSVEYCMLVRWIYSSFASCVEDLIALVLDIGQLNASDSPFQMELLIMAQSVVKITYEWLTMNRQDRSYVLCDKFSLRILGRGLHVSEARLVISTFSSECMKRCVLQLVLDRMIGRISSPTDFDEASGQSLRDLLERYLCIGINHLWHGDVRKPEIIRTKIEQERPQPSSVGASITPMKKSAPLKHVSINKRDPKGETRLHRSCRNNKLQEVKDLLCQPEIDVNIQDNVGWTALHEAVHRGNVDCVRELLRFKPQRSIDTYFSPGKVQEKCVNLKLANVDGMTALHEAVSEHRIEIIKLLLAHGGESLLSVADKDKKTPRDLATTSELEEAILEGLSKRQQQQQQQQLKITDTANHSKRKLFHTKTTAVTSAGSNGATYTEGVPVVGGVEGREEVQDPERILLYLSLVVQFITVHLSPLSVTSSAPEETMESGHAGVTADEYVEWIERLKETAKSMLGVKLREEQEMVFDELEDQVDLF